MEQVNYSQQVNTLDAGKVPTWLHLPKIVKMLVSMDVAYGLLAIGALLLWFVSLKDVNIRQMTDLGLVSVLPPSTILALVVLTVSFCLALRQPRMRVSVLLLHLVLLVFMLYGITSLVEEAPRFSTV